MIFIKFGKQLTGNGLIVSIKKLLFLTLLLMSSDTMQKIYGYISIDLKHLKQFKI